MLVPERLGCSFYIQEGVGKIGLNTLQEQRCLWTVNQVKTPLPLTECTA